MSKRRRKLLLQRIKLQEQVRDDAKLKILSLVARMKKCDRNIFSLKGQLFRESE